MGRDKHINCLSILISGSLRSFVRSFVTILPPVILSCDWLVTSTGKILIGQEMQAGPDFVKLTKHNNLINLL